MANEIIIITDKTNEVIISDNTPQVILYPGNGFVKHTHSLVDIIDAGELAAIDDAPKDSNTYGRKNGNWEKIDSIAGGAPVLEHGSLLGLSKDDHPQYLTQARGDVFYSAINHSHTENDITDLDKYTQAEVNQLITDITDSVIALDQKLDTHLTANNPHKITPVMIGAEPDLGIPSNTSYLQSDAVGNRFWGDVPTPITDHQLLNNRDALDAHTIESIVGLRNVLDSKAESNHTHMLSDITNAGELASKADAPYDGNSYYRNNHDWLAVPSEFPPEAHLHTLADITNAGTMAGINDAPADGFAYGRKNSSWVTLDLNVYVLYIYPVLNAGDGTPEGDINATDFSTVPGQGQVSGTTVRINDNNITYVVHNDVIYRYLGPYNVNVGLNGSYIVVASDLLVESSVSHHGSLTGLLDDDHPQYITEARGDARYDLLGSATTVQTNLDNHTANSNNPHNVTYAQLPDVPTVFPPDTHAHTEADIADLDKYTQVEVDAKDTAIQQNLDSHTANTNNPHSTTWTNLLNKPADFPPSPHLHTLSDIADAGSMAAADDVAIDNTLYGRKDGTWSAIPAGITAHGALSGLNADDHIQYHTDARGDARYSRLGHDHSGDFLFPQTLDVTPDSLRYLRSIASADYDWIGWEYGTDANATYGLNPWQTRASTAGNDFVIMTADAQTIYRFQRSGNFETKGITVYPAGGSIEEYDYSGGVGWVHRPTGSNVWVTAAKAAGMYTIEFGDGSNTFVFGADGNFTAPGNITASSDRRLKTNIRGITNPLEILKPIQAKRYLWKDKVTQQQVGLIAQEVAEALPEAVITRADGMLALNYNAVLSIAVSAINELRARVEALEKELGKQ